MTIMINKMEVQSAYETCPLEAVDETNTQELIVLDDEDPFPSYNRQEGFHSTEGDNKYD